MKLSRMSVTPALHRWRNASLRVAGIVGTATVLTFSTISHAQWQPVAAAAAQIDTCRLEPGPRQSVVAVEDSETLRMSDGQRVRLLGTLGPRPPLAAPNATSWQPERNAQAALRTLVDGADASLAFDHQRRDRYGRLLAHVFVWHNGQRFWVQGEMLAHGHARAYVMPGNTACISELLAHEKLAQQSERGLWNRRHYRILKPTPAGWLLGKRRHRFELIAGEVADVAVVGGTIYLNFGQDWRTDFTAALPKRALRATNYSLADILALKGRRVRVRGWIERRNGPYMKLAHPSLIELLDAAADMPSDHFRTPPLLADIPHWHAKQLLNTPRIQRRTKKRPATRSPDAQSF